MEGKGREGTQRNRGKNKRKKRKVRARMGPKVIC